MEHDEGAMALKRSRPMTSGLCYTMQPSANWALRHSDRSTPKEGQGHCDGMMMMIPQQPVPSFPPPDIDWKALHTAGDCTLINSHDSDSFRIQSNHVQHTEIQSRVDTGLVSKSNECKQNRPHSLNFSDDNDEDEESPIRTNVARTRLDFNRAQTIPTEDFETTPTDKPFDGSTSRPVAVTVTNETPVSRHLSPNCRSSNSATAIRQLRQDSSSFLEWPTSPAEAQFRFRIDAAQCSPILPTDTVSNSLDFHETSPPPSAQEHPGITSSSNINHENPLSRDNSKLSLSHDSSSSQGSKQRRLRPMPDMSAFDAGTSVRSGSSTNKSSGEENASSPKLACPPTPLRTPAWAHHDTTTSNPYIRSNSLIVTRVLATCPVQVLDGHSSLENSMDLSGAGDFEKRRASLSFSTVEEERGDEVMHDAQEVSDVFDRTTGITPPSKAIGVPVSIPRFSLSPEPIHELHLNPKTPLVTRLNQSKLSSSSTIHATGEDATISFATSFENLGELGCGAFGDVYKVRSKADGQLYAVKRNRRQFRGKRDRNMAMAEVRIMQKLQSVCADGSHTASHSYSLYVLFFFRAWQEEGFFYCQTELCCRDTCRDLLDSLRSKWPSTVKNHPLLMKYLTLRRQSYNNNEQDKTLVQGRLIPDSTIWKICHDVAAGLSHIHSHGIVHHDIKPSNIFFVSHPRLGAMCKIGDFGIAGEIGTAEDGQEGDTLYMAPELLSSSVKHPSADIFSLGLTLYELASDIGWQMPVEGPRWHELRSGFHVPDLPPCRHFDLVRLIQGCICVDRTKRPQAGEILNGLGPVKEAGSQCDEFLRDYLLDIERLDREKEEREAMLAQPEQTPRNMEQRLLRTPTPGIPMVPLLFTPNP